MKKSVWIGLCAVCVLSCTREIPQEVSSHAVRGGLDTQGYIPPAQAEALCFEPGVVTLYLSEDWTALLEQAASPQLFLTKAPTDAAGQLEKLGITGMKRLFPDAGEYEPRTRREGLHRWWVVEFDKSVPVAQACSVLGAVPGVEYVEKNRRIQQVAYPFNDPYWKADNMWGMNNVGHPGYDVNCVPVWQQYTTGNPNVVVAVVDGGIQLDHPDLKGNVAASGHYNYVQGSATITQHAHGTHVAGTIAAVNNNGVGVTGVAGGDYAAGKKGAKLLSLQVFETRPDGEYSAYSFATALKEAADKGAIISQNSWGYYFDFNEDGRITGSELEYARQAHENPERSFVSAVDYFNRYAGCDNNGNQKPNSPMKGGVVIFAAGNEDIPYGAPGNYDGCVAVGAITSSGAKASFSNYGDWVDVCAPGYEVNSTCTNGTYARYSGTSMACPHVSGVAALIASFFGESGFTADELRARLIGGARMIPASSGASPIGPLVDAWGSFQMNGTVEAPDPVTEYSVSKVGHNLRFDFTSTGAYGYLALAAKTPEALQIADYSDIPAGVHWAKRVTSGQEGEGAPLSLLLPGLEAETPYYVSLVAYSFNRLYSEQAAVSEIRTGANQPPVVEISDYTGEFVFHHYQMVDIPFLLSDPDGDDFSVSFTTSGRAQLVSTDGAQGILHFKLMCPIVQAPASFQAKLTVTDELGARTTREFSYSVLANVPPVQVREFSLASIRDLGTTLQLDLDQYFRDEDGEPLSYKVHSFDPSVVSASLVDTHTLELCSVGRGSGEVSVMASDNDGESVKATLRVLVRLSSDGEVMLQTDTFAKDGKVIIVPGEQLLPMTVRIFASSGSMVYENTLSCSAMDPLTLDLSALAPGVYAIEVDYNGKTYTFTLLKR